MGKKALKDREKKTLEASRRALQKTVVGRRIVAMETRKATDAKLTLDDGTTVMLRGDGACCAWGAVKTISEIIESDHAITHVKSSEDEGDELWTIYASKMTIGTIGVTADEGSGGYGFGITIEVSTDDHRLKTVHNGAAPIW